MPIVSTGKMVVAGTEDKEAVRQQNNQVRTHIDAQERLVPREGTVLYVNGKRRTIGKKSQYLLDMLTLDE